MCPVEARTPLEYHRRKKVTHPFQNIGMKVLTKLDH
jgi:hypothetical protein